MQKIPVIFGKANAISSYAIRAFTWSRWSHVGIIDGDYVVEALAGQGVVRTPLAEFKARYDKWEIAQAPVADLDIAYKRLREQIGKKYDYLAIVGIILRQRWDNTEAWICSELYAHISDIVRHDRVSRFTPECVWRISR